MAISPRAPSRPAASTASELRPRHGMTRA